jgi:hypothetical protein
MKKLRIIMSLAVLFILFVMCERVFEENPVPMPPPSTPYSELEAKIRAKYDSWAKFTWDQYKQFLRELSDNKFKVLPLNEMRKTHDNTKVIIGLRHDVDLNPFRAIDMARIEHTYGIRATYFILPTSEYYGHLEGRKFITNAGLDEAIRNLYKTGAEIGIHNDLLTVMIDYGINPYTFNKDNLAFFKSLHIPIYGTSAHGSKISKSTIPNFQIFSDYAKKDTVQYNGRSYPLGKHSLKEYGYEYEAYFLDFSLYLSDSDGKWNVPGGFDAIIEKLRQSVPGDRIEILIHPVWWGKQSSN